MYTRFVQLHKDKQGSTIMYVMAVMLLLLAVGVSVLTAAAANVTFTSRQRDYNQAIILADSIHRTILTQLQNGTDGNLSDQLVTSLFQAKVSSPPKMTLLPTDSVATSVNYTGTLDDITLNLSLSRTDGGTNIPITNDRFKILPISIVFSEQQVQIHESLPAIGNMAREPASALVTAQISIEVTIQVKAKKGFNYVTTKASYNLTEAELNDKNTSSGNEFSEQNRVMAINPEKKGTWELVRYETTESTP